MHHVIPRFACREIIDQPNSSTLTQPTVTSQYQHQSKSFQLNNNGGEDRHTQGSLEKVIGVTQREPENEASKQALPKLLPSLHKRALMTVHRNLRVPKATTVSGRPLRHVKAVRFAEELVPKGDLFHEQEMEERTPP